MELSTVLELVKAGFNRDEIMQMAQPTPAESNPVPVQSPVETPVPEAEPQPIPAPVDVPVAVPAPAPSAQPLPVLGQTVSQESNQPTMAELMQSIAKLTSAVQANAIANSVIPQGLQNPPSAEDMIAEIIRPTFKERS